MTRSQSSRWASMTAPRLAGVLLAWAAVAILAPAAGEAAFIGAELVSITASDDQGRTASAGIANPFDGQSAPDAFDARIDQPIQLIDGDQLLATVEQLAIFLEGDPLVHLILAVTAGASDVTVTVTSVLLSFAELLNPDASAQAEMTLTDNDGGGATLDSVAGNAGMFLALFNVTETYTELLTGGAVVAGAAVFSDSVASPIAGGVTEIQVRFSFRLSAGDSVSAIGSFEVEPRRVDTVIPEPAIAGLALLAACALATAATARRGGFRICR